MKICGALGTTDCAYSFFMFISNPWRVINVQIETLTLHTRSEIQSDMQ